MIRVLALLACLLTVCITASSAFIRHAQNGVGCDGWPACYRAAQAAAEARASGAAQSDGAAGAAAATAPTAEATGAVRIARSLHRVSATLVGVLVLLIAVFGWSSMRGGERIAAAVALVDTVFLAWLGRYTPHDLPLVTLGNLVGGLLLAAALAWIAAARVGRGTPVASGPAGASGRAAASRGVPGAARIALAALALLGLLAWGGTMIGARHAIDACDAPLCAGARFDPAAMNPVRATVAVGVAEARGMHLAHRVAGLVFAALVALLALRLRAARPVLAAWLAALAIAQILLGAGTALGAQALTTATLHNAVAALLAAALAAVAGSTTASMRPGRSGG